jgi:acetate kinase
MASPFAGNTPRDQKRLLTINVGSSSLKAVLYRLGEAETVEVRADTDRIGLPQGCLRIRDAQGTELHQQARPFRDHIAALDALLAWLQENHLDDGLCAIGQRVVHGGMQYSAPARITGQVIAALRSLIPLDTEHLPQTLHVIECLKQSYPSVPQIACFDTAFHRCMPKVAQTYPLPRAVSDAGVIRYGFHGLSCEYIIEELRALDRDAADGRVIVAHLGNGSSMTAIHHGVSIDTTMGLTPAGGLMMGTRSGDLDPGVLIHLLEANGLSHGALSRLVNQESGLLGVSGISGDMADLLALEASDPYAAEAVELFCYQARKSLGALVAALGGVNTLVFTAGIGQHAASVRERICHGLEHLDVRLDAARNTAHSPIVSCNGSRVEVRVIPTDEDLIIARHTHRLINQEGINHDDDV